MSSSSVANSWNRSEARREDFLVDALVFSLFLSFTTRSFLSLTMSVSFVFSSFSAVARNRSTLSSVAASWFSWVSCCLRRKTTCSRLLPSDFSVGGGI